MNLLKQRVLVVGIGNTGTSVARFCKSQGAFVVATDAGYDKNLEKKARQLHKMGIETELGQHKRSTFENVDLIIISPGVPHTIAPIQRAKDNGIPVLSEIELAASLIKEPIAAVTGTNGKTTCVTLLGKMLKSSGMKTFVGGNIGKPLIDYIESEEKDDIVVVELSSFQLDTTQTLRPKVGVLLNISEDHMDRYPDFHAYAKSKKRIFKNQQKSDVAIFNGSDPLVCSMVQEIEGVKLPFKDRGSDFNQSSLGAKIYDDHLMIRMPGGEEEVQDLSDVKLTGQHNRENIAAAYLAARTLGGKKDKISEAINNFKGLSHRIEYVKTIKDTMYYNDSKATNVNAVERALESFKQPVILLMGGQDKGSDFGVLEHEIKKRVKTLIVFGQDRKRISLALESFVTVNSADTLEEAINRAYFLALPDDVVLLSPGCASFDRYKDYTHRGKDFVNIVRSLR